MTYEADAKILKALADENRLHIMDMLMENEKCASDLLEMLDLSQPTLSHHMRILCEAGVVTKVKDGRWIRYAVSKEGIDKLDKIVGKYR